MEMPAQRNLIGDPVGERNFETCEPGILEELCEHGYFDNDRPEDSLIYELDDDKSFGDLTDDEAALYNQRVRPLLRIWFFEPERFQGEYARRRAPGFYDQQPDEPRIALL